MTQEANQLEEVNTQTEQSFLNFVISRADLINLIAKIQSTVPSRPAVPILSNILIEAENDLVTITATDLTVSTKAFVEAKVMEEGSITLPARRFFQLVRELTSSHIELKCEKDHIATIKSGQSQFKLHGMDKEEFPSLPDLSGGDFFTIKTESLKELLTRTSFAAAKDDSRHVLNGIFMQLNANRLTLTGTDGKRLARMHSEISELSISSSLIVPLKAIEEVIKILDEEHPTKVFIYKDKVAFETHCVTVISKLLSGDYPDVNRVIPDKAKSTVALPREELVTLLKQVSLFTSEMSHSVRFSFNNGELQLSAMSSDVGEGVVSMAVNYTGEAIDIAFNPTFFIDILRNCKDDVVSFGLIDSFNPGMITDQSTALFIIMPMRLNPS